MFVSLGLCLSIYLSSIFAFSFVSNPIYYCVLLLLSALSACGVLFGVLGFSWYMVLFCLVYVGGVYILFIFVSVYNPNIGSSGCSLSWGTGVVLFVIAWLLFGLFISLFPMSGDYSHYLCSGVEGLSYCLFCLVMLMGFVCVSLVVNYKDSFYR